MPIQQLIAPQQNNLIDAYMQAEQIKAYRSKNALAEAQAAELPYEREREAALNAAKVADIEAKTKKTKTDTWNMRLDWLGRTGDQRAAVMFLDEAIADGTNEWKPTREKIAGMTPDEARPFIQSLAMKVKDQASQQLNQQKFTETQRHNRQTEGAAWMRASRPDTVLQVTPYQERTLELQERRLDRQDERDIRTEEIQQGFRLTPADASKVRQKLVRIDAAKRQMANLKAAWQEIKNTKSAGPGAGYYAHTEAGQKFDKALASMVASKTAMLRIPGVGTMTDLDQMIDMADLPSRSTFESTTQQQMDALENLFTDIETGYRDLLGGQAGAGATSYAAPQEPAPVMEPGVDAGVSPEQVEAEMRRRGLLQ